MDVDREEAAESLRIIHEAMNQTKKALARSGTGHFFIIWGAVWLLGFLGTEWLSPALAGRLWLSLDVLAGVASIWVVVRLARRFRSPVGWRLGAFWLALMAYGGLQLWVLWPVDRQEMTLFITLMVAFGYVGIGVWFSGLLAGTGGVTTVLAVLAWLLAPAYLNFIIAFLGGGGMIGVGAYLAGGRR